MRWDGGGGTSGRRGGGRAFSAGDIARRLLLERFAPAAVLVNQRGHVVYYHGDTEICLAQPAGEPTQDLLAIARKGLGGKLRAALRKAVDEDAEVHVEGIRIVGHDRMRQIAVTVTPVDGRFERLFLVTFQERPESGAELPSPGIEVGLADEAVVRQLEFELHATREDLQSTIEEMETANEELKASNEEVMSMNEELQSANEELETSKEELQSLNEELSAVNSQLQDKVEELEASNNDFINLLNSSDVATVFLDMDLRIKRFTPNANRLLNLIPSDVRRPFTDITHNLDDPKLHEDAAAVVASLAMREREVAGRDGRWFIRRILPYRTHDNKIEGVVITFADITLVKKADEELTAMNQTLEQRVFERTEEALRARDLAEQANRAKSSFLAAMSHDLRTPLNGILGYSEAVLSGAIDAHCDDRVRSYIATIHAAGKHLLALINDILDLSALDAGKLDLYDSVLRPAEIADACLRLVSGVAQQSGVEVKIAVPKGFPRLRADERRVVQIVVNVLGNAIKFSPRGSMVTLSVRLDADDAIAIAIEDRGPGMSPEQVKRALEPFTQIDNMTARSKEGTGLGLPIAKSLAEAHGGSLLVDSHVGAGTAVTIRFPPDRTVRAGRQ